MKCSFQFELVLLLLILSSEMYQSPSNKWVNTLLQITKFSQDTKKAWWFWLVNRKFSSIFYYRDPWIHNYSSPLTRFLCYIIDYKSADTYPSACTNRKEGEWILSDEQKYFERKCYFYKNYNSFRYLCIFLVGSLLYSSPWI